MEVLSSRVLLRPTDFERSFRFYAEELGLHIYREWESGPNRGVVFFLGGGFLELSDSSRTATSPGCAAGNPSSTSSMKFIGRIVWRLEARGRWPRR
jgi:catechol 2,3-dioxygenase-like lactoylglutathione lyase family enzyme